MKLLRIGALMLSIGLSQAVLAKPTVTIGDGRGNSICIGRDCDRGWDRGRGGWERGRGGWDRGGDRYPRPTVCYARNARGITFQANGFGPEFRIQRDALAQCRMSYQTRNPATCRVLGCRGRY